MTPPPMIVTRLPSRLVKDHAPCRVPRQWQRRAYFDAGPWLQRPAGFPEYRRVCNRQ